MKTKLLAFAALLLAGSAVAVAGPTKESKAVREMIAKVNNHWQQTHSPEHNAFWDNAAYHTGNMEAYFLTVMKTGAIILKNGPNTISGKAPKATINRSGNTVHTAKATTM